MILNYFIPPNHDFYVWDVIFAWSRSIRESSLRNSTKSTYLTSMLKLIEANIVDTNLKLDSANEDWLEESKKKIDANTKWSDETKSIRKSCLNLFHKFAKESFDRKTEPYQSHPQPNVIKYVLSNVLDQKLTLHISPSVLCNSLSEINERDAYIIWTLMYTGQTLDEILNRRKEHLRGIYLNFEYNGIKFSKSLLEHIAVVLEEYCKKSNTYIFETMNGKRIRRAQVTRNLKQAGRNIGLDFDLTPKALHRYVNAYMSQDKRNELEKIFNPLFR